MSGGEAKKCFVKFWESYRSQSDRAVDNLHWFDLAVGFFLGLGVSPAEAFKFATDCRSLYTSRPRYDDFSRLED